MRRGASPGARSRHGSRSAHNDPELRSLVSSGSASPRVAFDLPFHEVSRTADNNESANDIMRLAAKAVITRRESEMDFIQYLFHVCGMIWGS